MFVRSAEFMVSKWRIAKSNIQIQYNTHYVPMIIFTGIEIEVSKFMWKMK